MFSFLFSRSGGGVLESIDSTIIYNPVVGGAHHYDLRAANPADTPGVISAREIHVENIQQWIEQAEAQKNAHAKKAAKKSHGKKQQKVLTEQ